MSLGIGSMIHILGGGTENSASKYYGRTIKEMSFKDDALYIQFEDGVKIQISDRGQSCCENRYMTCDDSLYGFEGHELRNMEVSYVDMAGGDYSEHEAAFLKITTDKGFVTCESHNIHNGYYGGICLNISEVEGD